MGEDDSLSIMTERFSAFATVVSLWKDIKQMNYSTSCNKCLASIYLPEMKNHLVPRLIGEGATDKNLAFTWMGVGFFLKELKSEKCKN